MTSHYWRNLSNLNIQNGDLICERCKIISKHHGKYLIRKTDDGFDWVDKGENDCDLEIVRSIISK